MPAYMEMLVSQSPPVFSHSPPTGFLADFASRQYDSPRLYRPTTLSPKPLRKQFSLPLKMPTPKKSILHTRPDLDDLEVDKCNQRKTRHISFADDQGYNLTHVKVMNEASNEPPMWSLQFLAHVTQGVISPVPTEQWTLDFRQPASDYLAYRRRLEENSVSLENVIIKEAESCIVGTVKVKNICFEKEVFVRSSWDNWKSQMDTYCTFSKIGSGTAGYTVFDTFSFKITLPPHSRHLEFCVCFRANGTEYWDNNDGKNYVITNRHSPLIADHIKIKVDSPDHLNKKDPNQARHRKLGVCLSPWSGMNTWSSSNNELDDSTPYCFSPMVIY